MLVMREQASVLWNVVPRSLTGTAGGQQETEVPLSALRQVELWHGLWQHRSVFLASLIPTK